MNNVAAIILAAGKGTRMNSEMPKVVFPLAGIPMIKRVVSNANKLKCQKIDIVVGYKKEIVKDTVESDNNITFIEQVEQNGTGHAVLVTEEDFKDFSGTVFILCGDVPLLRYTTLKKMLEHHLATEAACTVLTAIMKDPAAYGRIIRDENGNVSKITEFKDASMEEKNIQEINTGIYCFKSELLFKSLNDVSNTNNQGEYYLTDTLEILNRNGHKVTSMILDSIVEASGVNSKEQLVELESMYIQNRNHFDN